MFKPSDSPYAVGFASTALKSPITSTVATPAGNAAKIALDIAVLTASPADWAAGPAAIVSGIPWPDDGFDAVRLWRAPGMRAGPRTLNLRSQV